MDIAVSANKKMLLIDNKKIEFNHEIYMIEIMQSQVIVLLKTPTNSDDIDNIYSVGFDAKIIWRVQNRRYFQKKFLKVPYISIRIAGNDIIANDFYGARYIINSTNGHIIGRDITGRDW